MAIHPLPVYQTKGAFWAWMVYVMTKLFQNFHIFPLTLEPKYVKYFTLIHSY